MRAIATKQPVRKSVPNHLGRRTDQEKAAFEERQAIHNARDLKTMLQEELKRYPSPELCARDAAKVFKHWLMDIEHEYRMKNESDSQDVVGRIIALINK